MDDDHRDDPSERWQIGQFAELVGLSIPQLRRYDRLRLLAPDGREAQSGYRYYTRGQTGAARAIALLRSLDMPIADVRRILAGTSDADRRQLFRDHRARLEARLDEVRRLLEAVDALTQEDQMTVDAPTDLTTWLHLMPQLPVTDIDRSVAYYRDALGFRLAWRTADGSQAALASGEIEMLLLVPWAGDAPPAPRSAYVYVEDPDALCAEYQQAGADIVEPVASRPYGMRDFVVRDPDGHRFTLGRGEQRLREVADQYGLTAETITVNRSPCLLWLFQDVTEYQRDALDLAEAIDAVMKDASWLSRSILDKLATLRRPGAHPPAVELSAREREILALICDDLDDGAIAQRLGLARNTVRNHVARLYAKIDVNRRSGAVVWGRERGMGTQRKP